MSVPTNEDVIRIIKAVKDGNEEILNQIFDAKKYDVNDIHDLAYDRPILHISAERGHLHVVKRLISFNAKVDSVDEQGLTALHHASANGHIQVIEALAQAGASVSAISKNWTTPLHRAAQGGKVDVITLLVKKYAANFHAVDKDGNTALHYAASGGEVKACDILISLGIELQKANNNGSTPLHWASAYGKATVIEFLIRKGANSNVKNNNGDAPLHRAAWWGHTKAIEALISHGANIDIVNNNKDTALHKAVFMGQTEVIRVLMELKANYQIVNIDGDTPFLMAVREKKKSVVWHFIKESQLDINQFDYEIQKDIDTLLENKTDSEDTPEIPSAINVDDIKAYYAAMKMGSQPSNQFKLVTLGAEGAGKTSTINSLLSLPFQADEKSTVGAAVNSCIVERKLSSKWIKVNASFRIAEIPKLHNSEVKTVMSSISNEPTFTVTPGPAEPISQTLVNEVKAVVASRPIKDDIKIIIFDIGGQEVYYEIHFLFLAVEDIALLVFDCSKDLDEQVISRQRSGRFGDKIATRGMQSNIETIELLLHSVYSRGRTAPDGSISPRVPVVIMVGAHAENVSAAEKELIMQTIYTCFDGKLFLEHLPRVKEDAFHFIGNSDPNPKVVKHLRDTIVKAAHLVIAAERPTSYLTFEGKVLEKEQQSIARLKWEECVDIAKESGIQGEQAIQALLQYFMCKGILLYYPEIKSLKNEIFISPQEVSDLVCTVITTHGCNPDTAELQKSFKRYNQYAFLKESLLNFMLKESGRFGDKNVILGLLTKFNLASEIPAKTRLPSDFSKPKNERVFIVPSLLVYDKKDIYHKRKGDIVIIYYFPDEFLPESVFNQVLVKTTHWCCEHNYLIVRIRRGNGYFCFEKGSYQQFQLQMCKDSVKCYITIHHSVQPPSDKLPVLLQQRRNLVQYLESSIAEISKSCMPSAEPPVTCLECPLSHEDNYVPHIPLDINKEEVLVCHESLIVAHLPVGSYILLFKPSITLQESGVGIVVQESTIYDPLLQRPQMKHLNKIVIPKIAKNWREVADHLEYEPGMVHVIDQKWRDPIRCCQDLMRDWLSTDNGVGPKTWNTFLSTLKEIRQLTASVEKIENELSELVFSMKSSDPVSPVPHKKFKSEIQ